MVYPKPGKMAAQANEVVMDLPMFKTHVRPYLVYEKASLRSVPVCVFGDRMAKLCWADYLEVGKEIMS